MVWQWQFAKTFSQRMSAHGYRVKGRYREKDRSFAEDISDESRENGRYLERSARPANNRSVGVNRLIRDRQDRIFERKTLSRY